MKTMYGLIALLLIINLSALATFGYHRFVAGKAETMPCCQSGEEYLAQQLKLSSSQIEQMRAIIASFQERTSGISQQLFPKRMELVDQLKSTTPDSQRIHQLLQEIGALQTALQEQVIGTVLRQKAILTPEQEARFFELIGQRLIDESRCPHSSELNTIGDNCNNKHNPLN